MATVDLFAWAAARERARIEANLAIINAGLPSDESRLVVSHGVHAVRERWSYVSADELESLAARGGARDCRP